ncbi:hypothetical protein GCM10011380_08970 [Sphingomonas metalli]|uniref:Lipoprotein n=1 Tax=Sphingomonas metalli TaxID=1779358 RepID=A0A916WQQ9_9SPHN|nr:hypothetical protein [Sphingomonas metalli]GGB21583.1 hypothetical protein GCM10011380_08970 [Sphingomonas metalli]
MRCILVLALAASLSACATSGAHLTPAAASGAITTAQATFDSARAFAAIFMPFLSDAQRARVDAIADVAAQALETARTATTAAARAQALADAKKATAEYQLATGN